LKNFVPSSKTVNSTGAKKNPNRLVRRCDFNQSTLLTLVLAVIGALALVACKTSYYRDKTDRDVYAILDQIQADLFGKEEDFTIDTRYSERDVDEVTREEILADRSLQQAMEINVDRALELAIEGSREYQTQKESLYLSALGLSETEFVFSPQFLATAGADYTDPQGGGDSLGGVSSRLSVSQFMRTGGRISANLARDLTRFYVGSPRQQVSDAISFNLSQPLLRGFGSRVAAENLRQSERNVIYAIRDFNHYQNQFAVQKVLDYFRLLRGRDIIRNSFADYQSRTNETARLVEQLEAGRVSTVDLGEIQQAELTSKNNYINAIASYGTDLDSFKIDLGLPLGIDLKLDDSALEDITKAGLPLLELDAERAFELAIEYSWPLMNQIDQFEDSKRKVYVAANRLKPGLDFFANASLSDSNDSINQYASFDSDNVRTSMGFELDIPINRFSERNQYRTTLINFERALRNLGLALDNKRNAIRLALRNLKQYEQNYEIQKISMELASKRVTGASLTYQAGRATVDQIVRAQDNLVAARNALSTTMVNYIGARMNLLLEIGILRADREDFWISQDAVVVDLKSEQLPPRGESIAPTENNPQLLKTPDQLFQ
jgi:outer membrane protein TolC